MSPSSTAPRPLGGLGEIAGDYDALICDVWGVLHDGRHTVASASEALLRFRASLGPVVLLSNAPRLGQEVLSQLDRLGVPRAAYDAIVTSGEAARGELMRRAEAAAQPLALLHIGPARDRGIYEGIGMHLAEAGAADIVLCTGLYDDEKEGPEDYRSLLGRLKERDLTLLCANPDIKVQRGAKLIYCAGAVARLYEEMGGTCIYYGKPHAPVYAAALKEARARGRAANPLAIGDGLDTDVRGANGAGLDVLFITRGIHSNEIGADAGGARLAALFTTAGVDIRAFMPVLVW